MGKSDFIVFFFLFVRVFYIYVIYDCLKKDSQVKMRRKKNCVLVRCPPCSGETTNRKCLFAAIFLNVNCERGEMKGDGHRGSLNLSHSLTVA